MARKLQENKWITFPEDEEIQVLVRPFSVLFLKKMPSEQNITPQLLWEVFSGCVVDWKGILDAEGKPLPCNKETKAIVAENFQDILMWVFTELLDKKDGVTEAEIKN